MQKVKKLKGFTLIELLIVITIIGILAGLVIAVIDPIGQRIKATQAVAKAKVAKACLAQKACINSTPGVAVAADCNSFTELGIYSTVGLSINATTADISATQDGCTYTCAFADATGSITSSGGDNCRTK
ncbi:type II secretion system GspH family protein [Candidatus Parcubacteria bacterium]|nr:type II secretion system GspH family protein [Candidatus Parcubacteria bacterium]